MVVPARKTDVANTMPCADLCHVLSTSKVYICSVSCLVIQKTELGAEIPNKEKLILLVANCAIWLPGCAAWLVNWLAGQVTCWLADPAYISSNNLKSRMNNCNFIEYINIL